MALVKDATAFYFARDNLKDLWKNNFSNGFWVIWSLKFAKLPFSLRHLVPLFFVLFLILGLLAVFVWKPFYFLYVSIILLYLSLVLFFSVEIGIKEKSFKVFLASIAAFLTLHISYGLGSLTALIRLAAEFFVRK